MKTNTKLTVLATLGTVALGATLIGAVPAMAGGLGAGTGQGSPQGALSQTTGGTPSARYAADGWSTCTGYLDADGDGVCDTCGNVASRAHHGCARYSDENGDGICDACANGACQAGGSDAGFIDGDGDGICDHRDAGSAASGCSRGSHHGYGAGAHHAHGHGHC